MPTVSFDQVLNITKTFKSINSIFLLLKYTYQHKQWQVRLDVDANLQSTDPFLELHLDEFQCEVFPFYRKSIGYMMKNMKN